MNQNEIEKVLDALFDLNGIPNSDRIGIIYTYNIYFIKMLIFKFLKKGMYSTQMLVRNIIFKLDLDQNEYISENEFVEGCLHDLNIRKMLIPSQIYIPTS